MTDVPEFMTDDSGRDCTFVMGCPGCGEIIIAASLIRAYSSDPNNNAAFIVWMLEAHKAELDSHQALCVDEDTPNIWVWKPEQDGDEDDYQTM